MATAFASGAKYNFNARRRHVTGAGTAVDESAGPVEIDEKKDIVKVGVDKCSGFSSCHMS